MASNIEAPAEVFSELGFSKVFGKASYHNHVRTIVFVGYHVCYADTTRLLSLLGGNRSRL